MIKIMARKKLHSVELKEGERKDQESFDLAQADDGLNSHVNIFNLYGAFLHDLAPICFQLAFFRYFFHSFAFLR